MRCNRAASTRSECDSPFIFIFASLSLSRTHTHTHSHTYSLSHRNVLDFVVGTILSQNTTDVNSGRAFASLKAAFPTWEAVREAKASDVADSIRCGGLADTKVSGERAMINVIVVIVVIIIIIACTILMPCHSQASSPCRRPASRSFCMWFRPSAAASARWTTTST